VPKRLRSENTALKKRGVPAASPLLDADALAKAAPEVIFRRQ
jgi:hypothetical protein